MKKQYSTLFKQTTLAEHHAAYLFAQFLEYVKDTNNSVLNISKTEEAEKAYQALVTWFYTIGKSLLTEIHTKADAAYAVMDYLGILEASDLKNLFSSKNIKHLEKAGYVIPFSVEKRKYLRKKISVDELLGNFITEETPVEIPVVEAKKETIEEISASKKKYNKRTHYTGISRIHNQHQGIKVIRPVKEITALSKDHENFFVLHGLPGQNFKVLAYPCEAGKTVNDYELGTGTWTNPYMLAIRHDYIQRTGCAIIDVRKVQMKWWKRTFKAKFDKEHQQALIQKVENL